MAAVVRLAALALVAAFLALTLQGGWRLAVALAAVLAGAVLALGEARELLAAAEDSAALQALDPALLVPLWKAVMIAQLVRISGALCRDAGQSALAALIDLAGTIGALVCALPLLRAFTAMLESWL